MAERRETKRIRDMKILRKYKKSDLYSGLIVASEQNYNHLYEILVLDDCLRYKAVAIKHPYSLPGDGGIFEEYREGFWFSTTNSNIWCETEYSRKMNPAEVREDKLNELGI
jgi:hypothetical protein